MLGVNGIFSIDDLGPGGRMMATCVRCGYQAEAELRFGGVTSNRIRKLKQHRCNYPDVIICTKCMEEIV
jgi:hypothetical protein